MAKRTVADSELGEAMNLAQVFSSLGDVTRLRLLSLVLHNGETCVCDLTEATGLTQTNVSRHLANLRHAGLISGRKSGLWVYYSIVKPINPLHQPILKSVRSALEAVPLLQQDLAKLKISCCADDVQKPVSISLPKKLVSAR